MYIYIYICIYVYLYAYIHIYIYDTYSIVITFVYLYTMHVDIKATVRTRRLSKQVTSNAVSRMPWLRWLNCTRPSTLNPV